MVSSTLPLCSAYCFLGVGPKLSKQYSTHVLPHPSGQVMVLLGLLIQ